MSNTPRIVSIDVAKFIGVLFVVIGHLSSPVSVSTFPGKLADFFYQFHVPLFFFISGMFFNADETWTVFLKKRIRRLYLPYLLANICILIIHCLAHRIGNEPIVFVDIVKHFIKISIGLTFTDIAGATWFLLALFEGTIIYKAIDWIFSKSRRHIALTNFIVLSIVIFTSWISLPAILQRPITAMVFIHFGRLFVLVFDNLVRQGTGMKLIVLIVCLLITLVISHINHPDVAQNIYGNHVLFYISAFLGIVATLLISDFFVKVLFARALVFMGKQTMSILIWHLVGFKLVTILQMLIYGLPYNDIFNFQCNYLSGLWPLAYLISGITFPLLLGRYGDFSKASEILSDALTSCSKSSKKEY